MTWKASLDVDYTLQSGKTVAHFRHDGPLRILQSLYPEGDSVCHNIIVHPPGGLVGGDTLALNFTAAGGSHGLVTTPGATRFYRSAGEPALQTAHLTLEEGARLEWLPLEAICYSGCLAENRLTMQLAPGAELIGWDITALGLPAAGQPYERGTFLQHIEIPGRWLERGRIDAADHRLLGSPLGLDGHLCMASLFFAAGSPVARARRDGLLDIARSMADGSPLRLTAGATSPQSEVIVLRVLGPRVEPVMHLLRSVWSAWRAEAWGLRGTLPRIWSM